MMCHDVNVDDNDVGHINERVPLDLFVFETAIVVVVTVDSGVVVAVDVMIAIDDVVIVIVVVAAGVVVAVDVIVWMPPGAKRECYI